MFARTKPATRGQRGPAASWFGPENEEQQQDEMQQVEAIEMQDFSQLGSLSGCHSSTANITSSRRQLRPRRRLDRPQRGKRGDESESEYLQRGRSKIRKFLLRKLSKLSQILFMICLVLILMTRLRKYLQPSDSAPPLRDQSQPQTILTNAILLSFSKFRISHLRIRGKRWRATSGHSGQDERNNDQDGRHRTTTISKISSEWKRRHSSGGGRESASRNGNAANETAANAAGEQEQQL